MGDRDAVIVAVRRSPVVPVPADPRARRRFLTTTDLAAPVLADLAADLTDDREGGARDDPAGTPVDDVVLGCARGPGGNVARVAALAGLGHAVPGVGVDRQCGSGLEAVRLAAALVTSGAADVVLAGGVESASTGAPGRAAFTPAGTPDPEMGAAAEDLARRRGIDRERQDRYALRSHHRCAAARAAGAFDAERVDVAGAGPDGRDRAAMSAALLARFPPAFTADGTVTAGNSCPVSDGAAAVAVVPESRRARLDRPGLRVVGSAVAAVDPRWPGLGPVPAVRAVLRRAGVDLAEVAVVEITEAFAAQVLACTDDLGLDPLGADADRVCPQGGAIGLGHPWGASGALLLLRLFAVLTAPGVRPGALGLATCAVGGGQGVALLVERVG